MITLAAIFLTVSLFLNLLKALSSKQAEDLVICIDIAAFQLLGLSLILALHDRSLLPVQFALVLALLGFISTVIISRFIKT